MKTRAPISRTFVIFVAVMVVMALAFIMFVLAFTGYGDPHTIYNQTARAVHATNTAVQSLIDATNTSRAAGTQSP